MVCVWQGTGKGYKERPTAVYGLVWNPFAHAGQIEFYTYGVKHLKHWEMVRAPPPSQRIPCCNVAAAPLSLSQCLSLSLSLVSLVVGCSFRSETGVPRCC